MSKPDHGARLSHRGMWCLLVALIATSSAIVHADDKYDRWRDALDPEPYEKPTAPAAAPDWCSGYTSPHKYPGGSFQAVYTPFHLSTSTPPDDAIAALAEASCDLPPGHKNYQRRNAEVARARAKWNALDGSSDADQKRYLRYFITHSHAEVAAQTAELCKDPPSTSDNVFERFEDKARRVALACDKDASYQSPPFDSFLYWIDTPGYEPPALVRLQIVASCVTRPSYCAYDVARLDLAAIDREAASLNALVQLHIHFYAMRTKRWLDPSIAKISATILADAAKAAEEWQQIYTAHRAVIDRSVAIQRAAYFDGVPPKDADCDAAREDMRAIQAESSARTVADALAIYASPVGYLVRQGVAMCDSVTERPGVQAVHLGLTYEPRGPRMHAMRAVNGAQIANAQEVPWLRQPAWPQDVLGSRRPRPRAAAVVGSVKRAGEYLDIKFAKETIPFEENYNCHDTGRISGIDDHWNVRYGVHCDTRMKKLDATPTPIRVLAFYGAAIKPGALLWYIPFGDVLAFPVEVWSGPKKTKLDAIDGFALGKP